MKKKVQGEPVKAAGVWVAKWTFDDGSIEYAPFGWKDKKTTENFIATILKINNQPGPAGHTQERKAIP